MTIAAPPRPAKIAAQIDRAPRLEELRRRVEAMHLGVPDNTSAVGGSTQDNRLVLPMNPWRMRVSQGAGQAWAAGVDTTLNFDTITAPNFDSSGGFDTTTHKYTVQLDGTYVVTLKANFSSTAVSPFTGFLELFSLNNGSAYVSHTYGYWVTAGAGNRLDLTLTDELAFLKGDQLWVVVNTNQNSSLAVVGTAVVYWAMHLISR